MNRLEEIKERFNKYDFVHSYIDDNCCNQEWSEAHESMKYLLDEIERLQNELNGKNKMIESEWNVVVAGAKLIQSTYHKRSFGWSKIQHLLDRYTDGQRDDELKEELNQVT